VLRRPWRVPGGFGGGDTRRVERKSQTAGENRTMHEGEIVCVPEKDGKAENREERKRGIERGGREERSWWIKRDGTRGSSHHVVYQRHFILIFRERGVGGRREGGNGGGKRDRERA